MEIRRGYQHFSEFKLSETTKEESDKGPVTLFSMIPLKDVKLRKVKKNPGKSHLGPYLGMMGLASAMSAIDAVKRKKAESFANYLEPSGSLSMSYLPDTNAYDPNFLDNPDLKTARNKTVITLPGFLGTIIQPSTASELKKEINQHFKDTHPGVDATITLTQIRNLKKSLGKIGLSNNLELSSIAFAYVYLEKLIIKNFVNRANRKLIGAICLLLAAKVNDPKETDYSKLLETVERELEVSRKDVYANEFSVYSALEFNLFLPLREVAPHLNRLANMKDNDFESEP
ncbi:CDK5 and ABL1 enzyme substrate 1 [Boothiomyces macroporosus]|uniref:CDK5 and ABL1 enzyme substrate 1 n=1 Tax=Boothiomyces macroporosus TaxID=261099 RepID=A0AAD5UGM2_9FUNG|nr:CDK5 and ABL1 enzyme substrate 1 [Boothiomyces macroporosus]